MSSHKDDYMMSLAESVASASKDPNTKVGAVICDGEYRVVSTGFNGMVAGCWQESEMWNNKSQFVIHAEMNAALWARRSLSGCTLYCTHAPCINCLKHLMQLGLRTIYYIHPETKTKRTDEDKMNLKLLINSARGMSICNIKTRNKFQEEL